MKPMDGAQGQRLDAVFFGKLCDTASAQKKQIMRPGAVNFYKMCGQVRLIFSKCAAIMRQFYEIVR